MRFLSSVHLSVSETNGPILTKYNFGNISKRFVFFGGVFLDECMKKKKKLVVKCVHNYFFSFQVQLTLFQNDAI